MKVLSPVLAVVTALLLFIPACSGVRSAHENDVLPERPGPAYIQWLENQSCLRKAVELTGIVSGSELGWRYSGLGSPLPERAHVWFRASPVLTAWSGREPFFSALQKRNISYHLSALGVHGVFLDGTTDSGDEWAGNAPAGSLGQDGTSLSFGRISGTVQDYSRLLASFSEHGLLAGGALLPAHTGMGPDFFLSIRGVRDYPGLYAMMEIPQAEWPLLPVLKEDENAPLSLQSGPRRLKSFAPALMQDAESLTGSEAGWAVTGPVVGIDGVKRRWLYRWYEHPERPVLHWDDPSGAARRIMEADLIRQAGLNHQSLIGVSAGAWAGLDTAAPFPSTYDGLLEPALSALRELTRQAHRYGAAILLMDRFPQEYLDVFRSAGIDFLNDSVLAPALEVSLLRKSALPLKESLSRSLLLNIPHRFLWRHTADGLPVPAHEIPAGLIPRDWLRGLLHHPGRGTEELRVNAPTLAAIACGLPPGTKPDAATAASIRDAHMLQLATRAFLPGLLMLSGSDLDGGLPEYMDRYATPPLWRLDTVPSSRQGLPSGHALYGRTADTDEELKRILQARDRCGVAAGRLTAVPESGEDSVLMTVTLLPDGRCLAFFGNFSGRSIHVSPQFLLWKNAATRTDLLTGASVPSQRLPLAPWGWHTVIFS